MNAHQLEFVESILSFEAWKRRDEAARCREAYKNEMGERIAKTIDRTAELFEAEKEAVLKEMRDLQVGVPAPAG